MANVEATLIQNLIDEIQTLIMEIKNAGEAGRTKLKDINVALCQDVLGNNTKLNTEDWSNRPEDEQNTLHARLAMIRDSLRTATGLDGPTDPNHIMSGEYATTGVVLWWASIGFLLTILLLSVIIWRWAKATRTDFAQRTQAASLAVRDLDAAREKETKAMASLADADHQVKQAQDDNAKQKAQQDRDLKERQAGAQRALREAAHTEAAEKSLTAIRAINDGGADEASVLEMVILLGALGGSLHLVGSLVKYVGNRQLKRSWLLYYFYTPIAGAALAPIVYMLLRVGILSPTSSSTGGSNIANLNLIAIYAFAALSGLFGKTALDKLAEVFKTIFRSGEASTKDSIRSERPPGGSTATGARSP
jgi:hypothetical protein